MSDIDEQRPTRKVFWTGRQWCVTDYGVETIEPDRYYIPVTAMNHLTEGEGWPMAERVRHVGRKAWVDCEDFFAAFAIATHIHAEDMGDPLPPTALLNAMVDVRKARCVLPGFERPPGGESLGASIDRYMGKMAAIAAMEEEGRSFALVFDPAVPEQAAFLPADDDD